MAQQDETTVIGPSIIVSGSLKGDEDLTVLGRIDGEINLSKTLVINTSGVVKADIAVRNAIVSGVVVGNITATESVELTAQGRMVGDINAPRVIIVEGARFRGAVDMGDMEVPRSSEKGGRTELAKYRSGLSLPPRRAIPAQVHVEAPTRKIKKKVIVRKKKS